MTWHITPQEAQQLLWDYSDDDLEHYATIAYNETGTDLFEAAPTLAKTIAADTIEYSVAHGPSIHEYAIRAIDHGCEWWPDLEAVKSDLRWFREQNPNENYWLVARRVSPAWEVKE